MKKILSLALCAGLALWALFIPAIAITHTVATGDSLWKIAKTYEVGISELKAANPQIGDFNRIYPGDVIQIPIMDTSVTAFEQEVIRLINEIRTENGLKPLSYDWELARVARFKSQDMKENRYFAHQSPTYGSPMEMIRNFGISYRSVGENIARGYASPQAVVQAWMNSSGHRANILNASYTHIGVGYVASGNYWTQMFIRK